MVREMTPTRRVLAAVLGGRVDYVPPSSPVVHATKELMQMVGATWPEAHLDSKMMADLAAAPYEVCGVEAARVQFDLSLEAEVLGCKLDWTKPDRPPVMSTPHTDPEDIKIPDNLEEAGRIPIVLKAIEILHDRYDGTVPIMPCVTGPFTLAGHLAGIENLVRWTVTDPEKAHGFIEVAAEFGIAYAKILGAHGAHIPALAEPSASGDLISAETYRDFLLPVHQRMAKEVSTPWIMHICGDASKLLSYIKQSEIDCFSFDGTPAWLCRQVLGNEMSIEGSIDVIDLLPNGTPEQVYNRARQCIMEGVDLVGPACDASNGTSLENMRAYVRACKETPVPKPDEVEDLVRQVGVGIGMNMKDNVLEG